MLQQTRRVALPALHQRLSGVAPRPRRSGAHEVIPARALLDGWRPLAQAPAPDEAHHQPITSNCVAHLADLSQALESRLGHSAGLAGVVLNRLELSTSAPEAQAAHRPGSKITLITTS